jgi:4-hydroxy-tetrahydrodipicolinate reductase
MDSSPRKATNQDTIKVGLCGVAGRMGREILAESVLFPDVSIHRAYEVPAHRLLGAKIGETIIEPDTVDTFLEGCDVLVDFSTPPDSVLPHLEKAAEQKIKAVVGSTGFTPEHRGSMEEIAGEIPLLYSANMSLGINILVALAQQVQELVGGGFDVDIVEMHHRTKSDAPSGTALMIEQHLHLVDSEAKVTHHSLRGGDVTGEHSVYFTGIGERLELKHQATSRKAFTRGVFAAINFIVQQQPGFYDMRKVLGI